MSVWKRHEEHRHEEGLAGGSSATSGVGRLLGAARGPGSPRELANEDAATMHFHRAHLESVLAAKEATMSKPSIRTGYKAALASAGVVALMSTGAAFASSGHAPWAAAPSGRPAAIPSHSHPTADPSETASDDPSESDDPSAPGSGSTAGPNMHAYPGLCRAYAAGQKSEHGNALSASAFAGLVTAAGGPDAVTGFCASLVPQPSHPTHPVAPTHPTHHVAPTHQVAPTHAAPTHPVPTHPVPTHPAHPSHPSGTSHPSGSGSHPGAASHPSRP